MLTLPSVVKTFVWVNFLIATIAMYIPLILGAVDFIALGFTGHAVTDINWNTPWGVFLIFGPLLWAVCFTSKYGR